MRVQAQSYSQVMLPYKAPSATAASGSDQSTSKAYTEGLLLSYDLRVYLVLTLSSLKTL